MGDFFSNFVAFLQYLNFTQNKSGKDGVGTGLYEFIANYSKYSINTYPLPFIVPYFSCRKPRWWRNRERIRSKRWVAATMQNAPGGKEGNLDQVGENDLF